MADCLFCEVPAEQVIGENELSFAIRDGFPVTYLHTLVIPKRHIASYFELSRDELDALNELLILLKTDIQNQDKSVTGFNIGINDGEDAGQTIFHVHVHLIPRRKKDVEDPRGGVRHSVPGKGYY